MRRKDREITDINGIEEILLQCKTCHVAMVDDGTPYVVPLSYLQSSHSECSRKGQSKRCLNRIAFRKVWRSKKRHRDNQRQNKQK